jgi:hypothetical protein
LISATATPLSLGEQNRRMHLSDRKRLGDDRREGRLAIDVDDAREVLRPVMVLAIAVVGDRHDIHLGVENARADSARETDVARS